MSELINIGDVKDEHYRYKMPKPVLKVEGKGNGIKTVIPNMLDIAKALKIPPEYITKYFGFTGSQSKYDSNTGKAVVNGKIDMISCMATFNEFIKKFILCSKCKLPETIMSVDSKDVIHMKCNACGFDTLPDNQEKLYTYILNHPPPKQQNIEDIRKKEESKTIINKSEKKSEVNVEWNEDFSEEAVKRRREEEGLSERIQKMTLVGNEKEEELTVNPLELLSRIDKEVKDINESQLIHVVTKIKKEYKLKDSQVVSIVFESLFDHKEIIQTIKKKGGLLKKFCKTPIAQKKLLDYIEDLIAKNENELLFSTSVILDELYDFEIFSDDILKEWHKKKKGKFVTDTTMIAKIKAAAKPFITNLKSESKEGDGKEKEVSEETKE